MATQQHTASTLDGDAGGELVEALLRPFAHMSAAGMSRVREMHNAKAEKRVVYVLELSSTQATDVLTCVRKTGNIGALVDCLRAIEVAPGSSAYDRLADAVSDPAFRDACIRHDPQSSLVVCAWVYTGDPVDVVGRTAEDFGVHWAVVSEK